MRDDVMATFHPRCYNGFNCRAGKMAMRKWRGNRKRGRAWQNAVRAHKARLTAEEIDYLTRATLSKVVNQTSFYKIDRTPTFSLFRKRKP
jgi:Zn-dependent alcohol dehydrogenase